MEKRNLVCIQCPLGCGLEVTIEGEQISVQGNSCPRGEIYAKKEVSNPTRIVTSTVSITGGAMRRLPAKTASDIPKGKIFACMEAIKSIKVQAPVKIGDVLLADCAGTGVAIVSAGNVEKG